MPAALPVLIQIRRPDGSNELVRVGTATADGGAFVLELSALRVELPSEATPAAPPGPSRLPIGGTEEDLEYIAARARRTLADQSKSRWHVEEREILRQAEQELARLNGGKSSAG